MVNVRYIIPKGTFVSKCRGCGEKVFWITNNNVQLPVEKNGIAHWNKCKRLEELRSNPEEADLIKT